MGNAKHPTTVDLAKLLEGPRSRLELGATRWAIKLAEEAGQLEECPRPEGAARGLHYKLTAKGRKAANRQKAKG